nr:hypothetical protein [uncultured Sulfurimonas sp.]
MKYILLLIISTYLFAQTIHSSISTYYENKTFTSSLQKKDGVVYGIGADVHIDNSEYKAAYEYATTNTKQPPLDKNLNLEKLFLRYGYSFNDKFQVNFNYINIIDDNIAITDNGKTYGVGLSYNFNKKLSTNFTQFYTDYEDFNVYQSDLKIDFKSEINKLKLKFSSITKYITIDEENLNTFTKNAADSYLTSGLKLHAHYETYHFGMGAYFGKRAFAIMNDGFKTQHHAMEFDRTYAVGAGKSISDFVLRFQYIYQRATELPNNNTNVEVNALRLIANYKF